MQLKRILAAVGAAVLGAVFISPLFGVLLGGFLYLWWGVIQKRRKGTAASRSAQKEQDQTGKELEKELPELINVFEIAISAGLTVRLAVEAVVEQYQTLPESQKALGKILSSVRGGRLLADGLAEAPRQLEPLTIPLIESERYGVELLPALRLAGSEARETNRRKAEILARKAPVRMLFPLVVCILPAFGLLTVLPILIRSLERIVQ